MHDVALRRSDRNACSKEAGRRPARIALRTPGREPLVVAVECFDDEIEAAPRLIYGGSEYAPTAAEVATANGRAHTSGRRYVEDFGLDVLGPLPRVGILRRWRFSRWQREAVSWSDVQSRGDDERD